MRFPGEEGVRNPALRRRAGAAGWAARGRRIGIGAAAGSRRARCSLARRAAQPARRAGHPGRSNGPQVPHPARCVGLLRAGPPFPYLRWTGPPSSARSSAAARSAGSGERDVDRRAGDRMREREPRGVQELALQPVAARARRTPGRRRPGWPIASRCARIWCVRPVSSRTRSSVSCGSARSTSKCVTASRGSSVSVETRVRTRRSRPERRVDRAAPRRRAALDEREVLAHQLARARAAA